MSNLQELIRGFESFRAKVLVEGREILTELAIGQRPKVMFVACCDSRVDPSMLTGAKAGEIFVIRNIANLVPACKSGPSRHGTAAALQYAVEVLEIQQIVVLGHSGCGGIRALLQPDPKDPTEKTYVRHWMRIANPVRDRTMQVCAADTPDVQARFCEQESIKQSLANLMTYPCVTEQVESGRLQLYGWYFDIAACMMYQLDEASGRFLTLAS